MRYEIITDKEDTLVLLVNNEIVHIEKRMTRVLDLIDGYHTNNGEIPDIAKPNTTELPKLFGL